MLQGFQQNIFNTIDFEYVLVNLIVALMCGFLISLFYRGSYRGPHYSTSYVQALVVLSMVTALVIMVIGNNLARAFGLVGAMSIIRFRTAVKDTQDIVFIFFSLAAGMAAGVGLKFLSVFGTLFIGSILLLLSRANYAKPRKKEFLLQFQCQLTDGEGPYLPTIDKYCKRNKLVNMQSLGPEDLFELSFNIQLKDRRKRNEFVRELNQLPQLGQVRLFFDEDQ